MGLVLPEEPAEIKKDLEILRGRLGSAYNTDWDSVSVWYANRLPQYLWRAWRGELVKRGYTWQKFLKLLRYRTDDAILWASSKITWSTFCTKIVESIEGPLGEIVRSN